MAGGWIKIHRSMLSWEWYDDINTKTVFLHLLLTANHQTRNWHGIELRAGSRIISREGLAEETGLSVMQIRRTLNNLENTGEITRKTTNKYTIITLANYEKFQDITTSNATIEQPTNNQQTTTDKEVKELKNKDKAALSPADTLAKKEKYDPLTLSEACLYIANKVRDEHLAGVAQQWAKMRYARTDKSKKTRELNKNKVDLAFRSLTSWGYTSVEKAAACFQRSIDHGWLDIFEMSGGEAKVYFKE